MYSRDKKEILLLHAVESGVVATAPHPLCGWDGMEGERWGIFRSLEGLTFPYGATLAPSHTGGQHWKEYAYLCRSQQQSRRFKSSYCIRKRWNLAPPCCHSADMNKPLPATQREEWPREGKGRKAFRRARWWEAILTSAAVSWVSCNALAKDSGTVPQGADSPPPPPSPRQPVEIIWTCKISRLPHWDRRAI